MSIEVGARLSQSAFIAGSTTVYCQCTEETAVSQISVTVKGKEKTDFQRNDSRYADQFAFFEDSDEVFSPVDGRLPPGQYEWPFQVRLPESLPSSEKMIDAERVYRLVVKVVGPDGEKTLAESKKLSFDVVAQPRTERLS
uniref:Arrestin-like N-terminal domain-containing protein n=1 Tax=Chromera velia CCMP2878 TaxID=1169474 RepID=A0A0G4H4E3_9ALVE|eukprot:Cvel_24659.t1-p1 / transcript=Cvel_24659.t1 / gene=Cvel_24659 / organism=Chromera_velia_CCMP2878 / gene_product=hypothetical protein / transcript_product=hypothetical protein / location=Cvel_scaffold2696:3769-4185(-) / protein_length=139 / sequence_SO=supercontig / SO=protein_coding / is_pseudo=false